MTPTPEDIALANKIEERAFCPAYLDTVEAAQLIAAHTAKLRELAEIGRLAVEEERVRCALRSKLVDGPSGKIDHCMGLYDDFYRASITHREAVCAYLAKESKP